MNKAVEIKRENRTGRKGLIVLFVVIIAFLNGCTHKEPNAEELLQKFQSAGLCPIVEVVYPFDGTLFPPEIPAPVVTWVEDSSECNLWVVGVLSAGDEALSLNITSDSGYRLPADEWKTIKNRFVMEQAKLVVLGFNSEDPDMILAAGETSFMISEDPVEAPLFYREVNLPFIEAVKDPTRIQWRFGTIDSEEKPPVVLDKLPVCGNCHSFSSDGEIFGMDVDYASDKGSYAVARVEKEIELNRDKIFSWAESDTEGNDKTFGLLSQISPDGRYVVSTVKDRSVFVPKDDLAFSQLFFPLKGILEVYDREKKIFYDLPGADDPKYVQSNPSWSPDGKYIVFARSEAYKLKTLDDQGKIVLTQEECAEFLVEGRKFKFDLYRIPFNNGRGGKAEPLEGASGNGLSNFFAKYSPDGKWIVFCQAESYMLLQPDSQLFIIPAEGGEARKLACNTGRMNSWHTWSPNGKWLVFSSKEFSAYTQLMIAHIDEEGKGSPAVLLDRMTGSKRAANIPEFVNVKPGAITRISKNFVDDNSLFRAGLEYFRMNEFTSAENMFRKALAVNSDNSDAHLYLGYLLGDREDYEEAIVHLNEVIRINPQSAKGYSNLGYVFMWKGDKYQAFGNFFEAVQLEPGMTEAHMGMGALRLNEGEYEEAEKSFRVVIGLDPGNASAGVGLARALRYQGEINEALKVVIDVVRENPNHVEALLETGELLAGLGRNSDALLHFNKVLVLDPGNIQAVQDINSIKMSS
jgi:tetratricopeptide (TPR) repeat protein